MPTPVPTDINPDPIHQCMYCRRLLCDPWQSNCGHRACKACFHAKYFLRRLEPCPLCKIDVDFSKFFPDRVAQRELQQIPVACPNEGCQWNGYYSNYEGHYIKCDYQPTQCVHSGCGEMVAKGMLKRHAKQCQFRPQQCEWCQENILRNMKLHQENCPCQPQVCQLCGEQVLKSHTKEHLTRKCPRILRKYPIPGCTFEGVSMDIQRHLHSSDIVDSHQKMLERAYREANEQRMDLEMRGLASLSPTRFIKLDLLQKYLLERIQVIDTQISCLSSEMLLPLLSSQDPILLKTCDRLYHELCLVRKLCACLDKSLEKLKDYSPSFNSAAAPRIAVLLFTSPIQRSTHGYNICLRVLLRGGRNAGPTHMSICLSIMREGSPVFREINLAEIKFSPCGTSADISFTYFDVARFMQLQNIAVSIGSLWQGLGLESFPGVNRRGLKVVRTDSVSNEPDAYLALPESLQAEGVAGPKQSKTVAIPCRVPGKKKQDSDSDPTSPAILGRISPSGASTDDELLGTNTTASSIPSDTEDLSAEEPLEDLYIVQDSDQETRPGGGEMV